MNKRNEIQWLRALAIFAVLAFHIWPKKFPFGYLGVDIFFVISGYLMTSILAKSSDQSILTFYSRRIKRIFPLCLLVIAVSLLIGYFTLLPSHYAFLQIEAIWASLFVNNFAPMFSEGEYFELVSGFQFFLHTWSLGVEVQFYLIAPFLIKFILARSHKLIWIAAIGAISASAQLIIPSQAISFGLVFCRIWQFMIGTAAFCATANESFEYSVLPQDESSSSIKTSPINDILTKMVALLLIIICFLPISLSDIVSIPPLFRLLATILTGLFIVLNDKQRIDLPEFCDYLLVYVGDASYAIYLVHWPVIIFFKYFSFLEDYGSCFELSCIFGISLLAHILFEKPLGKQPWKINLLALGICYGLVIHLILIDSPESYSLTAEDAIKLNEKEAALCKKFYYSNNCTKDYMIEKYLTIRPKKHFLDNYCSFKFPNNNSSKTIMVLGNSFVYFQIRGIYDAIQQAKTKFRKIYVVSHAGCSLLVGDYNKAGTRWNCEVINGSHDALLDAVRPDVILQSSRFAHFKELQGFVSGKYSNDRAYNTVLKNVLHLANYTEKLIIVQPSPKFFTEEYKNPLTVANLLMNNKNISQFDMTKREYNKNEHPAWYRVAKAIEECPNCIAVPTENIFCDDTSCPMVDSATKIGRYCDNSHITPTESLKLVQPLIKAIDEEL